MGLWEVYLHAGVNVCTVAGIEKRFLVDALNKLCFWFQLKNTEYIYIVCGMYIFNILRGKTNQAQKKKGDKYKRQTYLVYTQRAICSFRSNGLRAPLDAPLSRLFTAA